MERRCKLFIMCLTGLVLVVEKTSAMLCYNCDSVVHGNCFDVDNTTATTECQGACATYRFMGDKVYYIARYCSDIWNCDSPWNVSTPLGRFTAGYATCCDQPMCNIDNFQFNDLSEKECYSCFYAANQTVSIGDDNCVNVDPERTPRVKCVNDHCAAFYSPHQDMVYRKCTAGCENNMTVNMLGVEYMLEGQHCLGNLCDAINVNMSRCFDHEENRSSNMAGSWPIIVVLLLSFLFKLFTNEHHFCPGSS